MERNIFKDELWFLSTQILIKNRYSGHYLDQKRLKQGLYRHPWDDISYIMPENTMGGDAHI